jgi:hypothetical protein
MTPPPLPQNPNRKSWAHHAALASLLAPLLIILLGITLGGIAAANSASPQTAHTLGMITGSSSVVLLMIGIGSGVAALCGIPRYGKQGILGRSIAGLVLSGLLVVAGVAAMAVTLQKATKKRQAQKESAEGLRNAANELQNDFRKSYDPEKGITNIAGSSERLDRYGKKIAEASRNLSGDDAAVMQTMSAYLKDFQVILKKYEDAAKKYASGEVLDVSNLKSKDEIEPRREIVRQLMGANSELKQFMANSEKTIRASLEKGNVSPAMIEATLEGYRSKAAARTKLNLQVRDCDQRICDGALGALNIIESEWGRWTYNAKKNQINFSSDEAREAYSKFVDAIGTAGKEQVEIQGRMVKMQ